MFRAKFALPVYDLIVTVDGSPIVRLCLLGLLTLSDTHVATQWLYSEGVVPAKRPLFVRVLTLMTVTSR